jgi:predicted enzyme related to lactoylglutathione lyase
MFSHRRFRPAALVATVALLGGLSACQSTGGPGGAELPLSDEPLFGKFVWHDLITDDVADAKRFYSGLFGWSFERLPRLGEDYTVIKSGGYFIGGMVQTEDASNADFSRWLGYLSVEDVDAAAAETSAAGGEVVVQPIDLDNGIRVAAVTDPQGAVLGLTRSAFGDPDDSYDPGSGHIVWNELLAADDQAAGEFYAALTGLESVTVPRRGGEYIMLRDGDRERAGIMRRPNDDIEPLWLTYFAVADPAATASQVAALGGKVLLAPSPELREGTVALILDPAGAVLALQKWPL